MIEMFTLAEVISHTTSPLNAAIMVRKWSVTTSNLPSLPFSARSSEITNQNMNKQRLEVEKGNRSKRKIITEEVASNRAHVQLLCNWNQSIFLEWSLQSGVGNEFSQASVFGNSHLEVPQFLLNFIQRFLFGSSRVQCWGIATIQTKNLDWGLLAIIQLGYNTPFTTLHDLPSPTAEMMNWCWSYEPNRFQKESYLMN